MPVRYFLRNIYLSKRKKHNLIQLFALCLQEMCLLIKYLTVIIDMHYGRTPSFGQKHLMYGLAAATLKTSIVVIMSLNLITCYPMLRGIYFILGGSVCFIYLLDHLNLDILGCLAYGVDYLMLPLIVIEGLYLCYDRAYIKSINLDQ